MRDIKFRAYDKIDKRLIIDKQDFIPLIVTNKGVFKLDTCCEDNRWIEIDKDRFVLMQYTGLKDKNGVEIYEGDILKDLRCMLSGNRANCRVFYQEDRGRYVFGGWEIPAGMLHTFEVIGNIYENPESLN